MHIFIEILYLIASIIFIIGIKLMGKTHTARRGNFYSAIAMLIAIVATLLQVNLLSFGEIIAGMVIGGAIGWYYARTVEMTAMPEMVALFNGFGGLASTLVGMSDYWLNTIEKAQALNLVSGVSVFLGVTIGAITFTGSYLAYIKLKGRFLSGAVVFAGQHLINLILFIGMLAAGVLFMIFPENPIFMLIALVLALALGVLTVIPIGGADMPVVVSLLNSYSGIAACLTGFVLNNQVLIITGALVGSSGIILTQIMCKAMNRSLLNVLLGGFGQTNNSAAGGQAVDVVIKEVGVEEAAMIFDSASSVVIVPGYGMAVAQAQHAVREFADLLEKRNISIKFAIHPVAGRMPGHMNVLLAEANISYDKLIEMDMINDDFQNTDVALVIGANDVVNPAARNDQQSPIYGMPILNVDKARTVIVSKRGMSKGYAGVENELFGYPNTLMLFGDAKATINKVSSELKEMGK
ncbi:MAG: NAD(P)(+) transhydrogenase (Re/Si-specific) subunit beta [Microscillaceae bacterium]|jgi:NAD(P) transhydrogenase subunit beta|nr:NAD(P)(+) transhydrogenase (Re/Si-specific) subunit beta [Microscillaceae bacterium]